MTWNHTTLQKLALPIFEVFIQIFLNGNISLIVFRDNLTPCETNLDDSIDSGNFSVPGYLPLIQKDYVTPWPCSLCEGMTSFCNKHICRKLIYVFD